MVYRFKKNISVTIRLFGIFILGSIFCGNRFLGIAQYSYIPIVIIICSSIYYYKNQIRIGTEQLCVIGLLLILILNLPFYTERISSGVFISYILYLLLFLVLTGKTVKKEEIKFLIKAYIISGTMMALSILIFKNELDGWTNTYRYTIKSVNNVYVDPNFLAAYISGASIYLMNKIFINKGKKRYFEYSGILIMTLGVVMTGSRAGVISIFIGYGIVIFSNVKIKNIILIVALVMIMGIILFNIIPEGLKERIFFESYNDGSNIRRVLNWSYGIKSIAVNPIIGNGFIESGVILTRLLNYPHAIHCTYILLFSQWGIVGVSLIVIWIANIVKEYKRKELRGFLGVIVSIGFTLIMIEQNFSMTLWINIILLYFIKDFKVKNPNIKMEEII